MIFLKCKVRRPRPNYFSTLIAKPANFKNAVVRKLLKKRI